MKQKISKVSKTIISLVIALSLTLVSLIGLTVAYFTDSKSYSGTLDFGYIELDVTGDSISGSDLTFTTDRKKNGDATWTGSVMPGDTITMKFSVGLKSDCEPAYYLVRISDAKGLFKTTGLYYSNTSGTITESTTTNKAVGTITKGETHPFTLTVTIPTTDETNTGDPDTIGVDVCAVQQANLSATAAYEYLYNKLLPYTRSGNIITFGSYPQTVKASDVTVSSTADSDGYYTGSDGAKYVKITAAPNSTSYTYSDNTTVSKTETYFKIEPLQWRVIKEESGVATLVCLNAIKAMAYQPNYVKGTENNETVYYATDGDGNILTDGGKNVYANNYKYSALRTYLIGDFYTKTFSAAEKGIIQITDVDNSLVSTGDTTNNYTCEDTKDKVFALSRKEMSDTNKIWGEVALYELDYKNTDYALATGAATETSSGPYKDCGYSWLRSPYYDESTRACIMGRGILGNAVIKINRRVVLPALNIVL